MRASTPGTGTGTGPKIVVQYRGKRGKVYELKSGDSMLALHILPPEDSEGPGGNWHVEARAGASPGLVPLDGSGATAADALSAVAQIWATQSPALATLNWEAIARELRLVQAL